jgi:hypothetical protein
MMKLKVTPRFFKVMAPEYTFGITMFVHNFFFAGEKKLYYLSMSITIPKDEV